MVTKQYEKHAQVKKIVYFQTFNIHFEIGNKLVAFFTHNYLKIDNFEQKLTILTMAVEDCVMFLQIKCNFGEYFN